MIFAKRISCISSLIFCAAGSLSVSAEIYRCQAEQDGRAVFTDNKYSCHLAAATNVTVKPQVLRVERKLIAAIPDLSQYEPSAGFPDEGSKYCGPVAVSNSLSTVLGKAVGGMPSSEKLAQQIELARTLGSDDYMATDHEGTSPSQLLHGVDRYLETHEKIQQPQLEYHGQRSVPRKYNPGFDKQAELPWLIEGIKQEKHIWLNIGWYQAQANGKHKRIGGHWVTLVGYEKLGNLKDGEGEYLIINDPATRGGDKQEQISVKLAKLNGRNGFQLMNQRSKPNKADMAWIEGAIQLAL
jgi:hypothetical protein